VEPAFSATRARFITVMVGEVPGIFLAFPRLERGTALRASCVTAESALNVIDVHDVAVARKGENKGDSMSVQGSSPELVDNSSKSVSSDETMPDIKVADDQPDTLGHLSYLIDYLKESSGGRIASSYQVLLASLAKLKVECELGQEFDNLDILKKAQDDFSAWKKYSYAESSKNSTMLNKAIKNFENSRDDLEEGFHQYLLAKKGVDKKYSIIVDKRPGGRGPGDRTKWSIALKLKPNEETKEKIVGDCVGKSYDSNSETQLMGEVSYYPAAPNDGRISRALFKLSNYPLLGWRRALLQTVVISTIITGTVFLWLSFVYYFSWAGDFNTAFMVVVVVAAIGFEVSPFYRVFFWKVVKAPGIFEFLDPYSTHQGALLLVLKKHEVKDGVREIRTKKYSGVCPRCKGDVVVVGGGFEFPRRLVGRCLNSPAEHIYSFDISSEQGAPLR
jgi:hypothetical protein